MGARKQFVFHSSFLMKAESRLTLKEVLLHLNKPHTSEQGCKARSGTFLSQREESRSGGRKKERRERKERRKVTLGGRQHRAARCRSSAQGLQAAGGRSDCGRRSAARPRSRSSSFVFICTDLSQPERLVTGRAELLPSALILQLPRKRSEIN